MLIRSSKIFCWRRLALRLLVGSLAVSTVLGWSRFAIAEEPVGDSSSLLLVGTIETEATDDIEMPESVMHSDALLGDGSDSLSVPTAAELASDELSSDMLSPGVLSPDADTWSMDDDIPEEILRTEIITGARSPLTGEVLTAAEYAHLQATLASPAGDTLVSDDLQYLIFLLQFRRAIKPIIPFL